MIPVNSTHAPSAIGPYSHGMRSKGLLFCSGQTPIDPVTMKIEAYDIEGQTHQAIANIKAILDSQGLNLDNVVKTNVYLAGMEHFEKMNSVYQSHFASHKPARTTVAVKALPLGALIEIECIAEFKN